MLRTRVHPTSNTSVLDVLLAGRIAEGTYTNTQVPLSQISNAPDVVHIRWYMGLSLRRASWVAEASPSQDS